MSKAASGRVQDWEIRSEPRLEEQWLGIMAVVGFGAKGDLESVVALVLLQLRLDKA